MPASESEEFEFRLRAEKEGAAPPVPAFKPRTDADVAAEMPEWERRAAAVGRSMVAPFEASQQLAMHNVGHGKEADTEAQRTAQAMEALYKESPAAARTGTATDITSGFLAPGIRAVEGAGFAGRLLANATTGGIYSALNPVTSGGDFATEKVKQVGGGTVLAGGLSSLLDGLAKIPGLFKKAPAVVPGKGEGAEAAVGELQRTRDVMEGRDVPARPGVALSEYETLKKQLEDTTRPLREKAFASNAMVDVDHALKVIDRQRQSTTIPGVLKALDEAEGMIRDAIEKSGGAGKDLTSGMTSEQRKQWGKFMEGRGGPSSSRANLPLVDETRQGINDLIAGKGGKEHGPFAQKQLMAVQDALRAKAAAVSPDYAKYLDEYAKGAKLLDKFSPQESVLGKATSGSREFQKLTGMDAQKALDSAFSGKRAERDLEQLVALTKHSPEAAAGLRTAFKDWVMQPGVTGEINSKALLERWRSSRPAVEKSGMFAPEHLKNIDGLMADLAKAESTENVRSGIGGTVGFMVGLIGFHPVAGAYAGRRLANWASKSTENKLDVLLEKAMGDPETAALLQKPATSANLQKIEKAISVSAGREAGEETPAPRRDPLSFQPQGF